MIKSWEEYYNDPEIVDEPSFMREIHAIRLQMYDEKQSMTPSEYCALLKQRAETALASYNIFKAERNEKKSAEG